MTCIIIFRVKKFINLGRLQLGEIDIPSTFYDINFLYSIREKYRFRLPKLCKILQPTIIFIFTGWQRE